MSKEQDQAKQDQANPSKFNSVCNLCFTPDPGTFQNSRENSQVRSNVREFIHESFTVWRCAKCRCLHTLEPIDSAKYYRAYPMQLQKYDFTTRIFFDRRLNFMKEAGLTKNHSILDYGCGNGGFVHHLIKRGYPLALGYDPYSEIYSDKRVLEKQYDWVTSQDVIEHVEDPKLFFHELSKLTKTGGRLSLGTPDASQLDINSELDAVGRLHQPYHRHLLTAEKLLELYQVNNFTDMKLHHDFYVNTPFPFLNSSFIFNYDHQTGGAIDAAFEKIQFGKILKSPKLLLHGFFGYWISKPQDVVIHGQKPKHNQ